MARNEAYYNKETDTWEFRGSSFGGCLHGLVMSLRGATKGSPDLRTRMRFSAGNQSEDSIKEDMIAIGAADKGPPRPGELGVMWDAGKNLHSQRAVRGHYIGGPDCHKWVCTDYPTPDKHIHAVVQCSLDGWGIGTHEFLDRVGPLYEAGCVHKSHILSGFHPFIWEHKTMQAEKFEALVGCCEGGAGQWMIDPLKFQQKFRQYAWQLTAQAFGVHSMLWDVFRDEDPELNRVGGFDLIQPRIFFSVETVAAMANGDFAPTGRYLFYIRATPFTGSDIAVRLAETVRMFQADEVPKCDSDFKCDWPMPPAPPRTGTGPESSGKSKPYKFASKEEQVAVDLSCLA